MIFSLKEERDDVLFCFYARIGLAVNVDLISVDDPINKFLRV